MGKYRRKNIDSDEDGLQKYIDEIKEIGDHQYDPGYWTGGNISPYLNSRTKHGNKLLGLIMLLMGLMGTIFIIISLLSSRFSSNVTSTLLSITLGGLLVVAGVIKLRKGNN